MITRYSRVKYGGKLASIFAMHEIVHVSELSRTAAIVKLAIAGVRLLIASKVD